MMTSSVIACVSGRSGNGVPTGQVASARWVTSRIVSP
jgi:hypothetical protein